MQEGDDESDSRYPENILKFHMRPPRFFECMRPLKPLCGSPLVIDVHHPTVTASLEMQWLNGRKSAVALASGDLPHCPFSVQIKKAADMRMIRFVCSLFLAVWNFLLCAGDVFTFRGVDDQAVA
jgi:hypothetical protein